MGQQSLQVVRGRLVPQRRNPHPALRHLSAAQRPFLVLIVRPIRMV